MVEDVVRALGYLCLGTRMKRIGERLQADTQRIIDAHGMTGVTSQFPYLAALARLGPLTIGELADSIGVTQPAATRTVMQMAQAGLIVSEPADDDQRRRIVQLTEAGASLVAHASQGVWPQIEAAVNDLCADLDGPLLEQLAAIEDGLSDHSLLERSRNSTTREART